MIKEIIVVEGRDDTVAIKRAVDADTIETGGSAINSRILKKIELAQQRRGVIVFTDPDHAGERIRKIISNKIPGVKHAFIKEQDATRKGDIGVENASPDSIRAALSKVHTTYDGAEPLIDWQDLIEAGLIVHKDAANRRMMLGNILGIGYCNGKQLHKRLTMFQISREEFVRALEQIEREGS
ncbi:MULTISPECIES: ribonuclease M5 [unclassified Paenibacillus]|uniref:Ribonuclease M5 n=1 Tax=Paenibacillus provencensis TaxID=441151 RepID=A0ABW3PXY7_9BACL|nr:MULTISPECIES: ribonuclease M5 [unclassified Paenibacillus]MCM3130751.1 ribonuclease M5 [Paenibacillus sp. MER 78]SFS94809.1 RNAse M5 [Paenibacillus sp. 453mf]